MTLTAAGDILESQNLINLNNPPLSIPTSGEGGAAFLKQHEDLISTTASVVQFSTYTMGPRIPTNAKIKKVQIYGKGIDTNATAAVAVDINLIFSDAPIGGIATGMGTNDGTSPSYAGQIPTSALTGNVTSITAYASPNKMFGSAIVPVANSGAYKLTDVTFVNSYTFADRFLPIWDVLGFAQDPGGFLNFFLVVETAASTAAAGTIGLIVDYAD